MDYLQCKGRWPELLPFLVQLTKAPSELQRRSGLNIFGGLIQVRQAHPVHTHLELEFALLMHHITSTGDQALAEDMRAVHEQLRQIFVEALGDVSYSVRLAALTNVSFFLIVAREQRPNFQPLLPTMLDVREPASVLALALSAVWLIDDELVVDCGHVHQSPRGGSCT
mgnify:FL=1